MEALNIILTVIGGAVMAVLAGIGLYAFGSMFVGELKSNKHA